MKQGILIAALSLSSAIAVAGWARRPAPAAVAPQAAYAVYDQAVAPAPAATYAAVPAAAYAAPAPLYRQAPAVRPAPASTQRVVREPAVAPQPVAKKSRPAGQSVAIIAGSAGAGAAIGGLAGGGKGAAIGALSGGAAGFVFDRVTRNR